MKIIGLLLISLWSFSWARPVSRHPGAHHSNSKEHWSISVEEGLEKRADSTDLSNEDAGNRLSSSTEDRRRDLGDSSCENCESDSFTKEVSSNSLESFSETHEWSTQDNEERGYFGHQMIHRKRADNKDSHNHRKEINKESSVDESAGRMSLEDRSDGHLLGNKESKEQFDVENDGMVYTPEQVLYTFKEKGGSDLTAEEETSGDDSLDGNNNKDPGYTKSPGDEDGLRPPATHGEQDGGHTGGRHSDDSSSSSSSSSESRNLEKEDNHIIDNGRRHGGDSYSSSQEDRYDFQSEEMQGDEPRTLESHDSDSRMLPEAIHSKESSQEIHSNSKTVEHFERKAYHYVDGDSDEDNSPEYEQNKSFKEDDDNSEVDSQLVEDISQSIENVSSQSREDETSHSGKSVESSSRGHSRENLNSHSREDMHSQSREDVKHAHSREHDKHSQSTEDDKHSQSREDKHSQSREDDKHSQSREDKHSQSREDDKNSQSREDDKHSWSKADAIRGHSQSQSKEDMSSHSREDKHRQPQEDDIHSQSIEVSRQSRENENTVSEEHIKSDSTEDTRNSQEKVVQKSKETEEESNEHSPSKSQESHSVEKLGSMPPRAAESREFKWHHSRSSEKSSSMEESEESAEDTNESIEDDSKLSQSASSESSKVSEESASSDDSNSNEGNDQQSRSAESSESKEEVSRSVERPSQSREDTMSQSDSVEDNSWSRSKELESRKLMLDFYHNKPFSDYDDNDCQDGY